MILNYARYIYKIEFSRIEYSKKKQSDANLTAL